MKIALIGFGTMGQLVAAQAIKAGDEIGLKVTSNDCNDLATRLRGHDVAIDFSVAESVARNIEVCLEAGVPIVEGTTGWKADEQRIKQLVIDKDGTLVYGANFSIGVNILYRIVENASQLFAALDGYAPFIEEVHHARKRDAPSGTAVNLRDLMVKHLNQEIPTSSTRAGFMPGTHRVGFDSEADQITLTHTARSREGFASGALLAARWSLGRKGVYEFGDVLMQLQDV
jgi:4-hydroxy-tetrahydrodipicolinate reductase